jgi:hypothetical protein
VPNLKMNNILTYLQLVVDNINQLTARKFAAVACKIIALSRRVIVVKIKYAELRPNGKEVKV